jgi:hypothetical protein
MKLESCPARGAHAKRETCELRDFQLIFLNSSGGTMVEYEEHNAGSRIDTTPSSSDLCGLLMLMMIFI